MREDDSIRLYAPVVRRIIILVAVIIAVPVVLWTITTFMRTYVGPPKMPTFRSIASTTPTTTPSGAAADTGTTALIAAPASANASQPSPVATVAAPATDAGSARPAPPGLAAGDQLNNRGVTPSMDGAKLAMVAPAAASPAQPAAANAVQFAAASPAQPAAASAALPAAADNGAVWAGPSSVAPTSGEISPTPTLTVEPPQTASSEQEAEALPATPPIAGPIPLPHPRPRYLAMAQAGIPMPRPRPAESADANTASGTNGGPLGWLGNIFRQQPQPEQQQ